MRILLVEDDRMIAEGVRKALRADGFAVDWVQDGEAALTAVAGEPYDMMLLDLGLPKRDGLEVLKTMRARGNALPVLIVTARDAIADRVKGLDAGADDYLVKPFDLDELGARMRALIRRHAGRGESLVRHGELALDPVGHQVTLAGNPVALSAREFALLEALADLHEGIARATRLAEQLLALARSEPDGKAVETQVDLSALLDECVRNYVLVAQERGVDLGIESSEPASVTGDPDSLRVMFNNLIDNATKYTPKGGRVDIGLKIQDGHPVVDISDSGPGIPKEERERVFDRFYRVGESANRARTDVAGSGLGLAIVRRIAEQHGAKVVLESSISNGLRVVIAF